MNKTFRQTAHKVFTHALNVKDRLDRPGDSPDIEAEHHQLLTLIRGDGGGRQMTDYGGDGVFLGARYALACWVDELFIIHCQPPWADQWKERTLEFELFGTALAATRFWEQADIVLRRPNAPKTPMTPGPDAVEAFFLCVVLGFRGTHFDHPAKVREYVEEMRSQLTRPVSWQSPHDLGVKTNVVPLEGRATLRRVVGIYGSVVLVVALVLLAVYRFYS
jgi:type VI protein secretion system component VasF